MTEKKTEEGKLTYKSVSMEEGIKMKNINLVSLFITFVWYN